MDEKMKAPLLAGESSQQSFNDSLLTYLYAGHFLARWGARMWEFSVGLYMIHIWPDSLLFAAIYGVVESSSIVLFGPIIGHWVDRLTYVQVLRLWLFSQNFSFMVAGGTVIALLVFSSLKFMNFATFIALVIVTNISGAIGELSTLAGTILVERQWVVVISEGQSPEILTKMISVIRRIDLTCKLFAPVFAGFIISFVSLKASAVALAIWNTVSVWFQYWLLMSVYNGIPVLSENDRNRMARVVQYDKEESTSNSQEKRFLISDAGSNTAMKEHEQKGKMVEWLSKIPYVDAWIVYIQQDVVLPGVALAMLFFNILSFGTLMTATLEWDGIPAYVIGIARGVSASIGIAATVLYPRVQSWISTLRTGLWSIWIQWSCLLLCVASIWVQNRISSAWMLMGGVAASRLGLWMFDLSVIQLMQDHVPESDRCVVGGVQNSLQSMFNLLTFIMGIVISNPKDFWKSTIFSFSLVTMAAALSSLHVYRVRKHLIHFEKLFAMIDWLVRPSSSIKI